MEQDARDRMLVVAAGAGGLSPTVRRAVAELRDVGAETVEVDLRSPVAQVAPVAASETGVFGARLAATALDLAAGDPSVSFGFLADGALTGAAAVASTRLARTDAVFALFPTAAPAQPTGAPTLVIDDAPSASVDELRAAWGDAASLVLAPRDAGAFDVLGITDPVSALVADFAALRLGGATRPGGLLEWMRAAGWDGTYPLTARQRRVLVARLEQLLLEQVRTAQPSPAVRRRVARVAGLLSAIAAANVGLLGVGTAAAAAPAVQFADGLVEIDLATTGTGVDAVVDHDDGFLRVNGITYPSMPVSSIEAIHLQAGTGTTANVVELDLENFHGSIDVQVDLHGGDDELTVNGLGYTGQAELDLGAGDDLLDVSAVGSWGSLDVFAGEGDDAVDIGAVGSSASVAVDLGAGNDLLGVSDVSWYAEVDVAGGDGSDDVVLGSVGYGADVDVDLGAGHDSLLAGSLDEVDLTVVGGLGNDLLGIDRGEDLGLDAVLSEGDDTVDLGDVEFDEDIRVMSSGTAPAPFSVDLGDGNDVLLADHLGGPALSETAVGAATDGAPLDLSVVAGAGADRVELGDVSLFAAGIDLGAGDDDLTVGDMAVKYLDITLGAGADVADLGDYRSTAGLWLAAADVDAADVAADSLPPGLHLDAGTGADDVSIGGDGLLFGHEFEPKYSLGLLSLGDGDDTLEADLGPLGIVLLEAGAGDDTVALPQPLYAAFLDLGAGNDLADAPLPANLYVLGDDGDDGDDSVTLHAPSGDALDLEVWGGPGEVNLYAEDAVDGLLEGVDRLDLVLGSQDDTVELFGGGDVEAFVETGEAGPALPLGLGLDLGAGADHVEAHISANQIDVDVLGGDGEDVVELIGDHRPDVAADVVVDDAADHVRVDNSGGGDATPVRVQLDDFRVDLGEVSALHLAVGDGDDTVQIDAPRIATHGLVAIGADGGDGTDALEVAGIESDDDGQVLAGGVVIDHRAFESVSLLQSPVFIPPAGAGAETPPSDPIAPPEEETVDTVVEQVFPERTLGPGELYTTDTDGDGHTSEEDPLLTTVVLPGGGTVQVSELTFQQDRVDDQLGDGESQLDTDDVLEFGRIQIDLTIDNPSGEPATVGMRLHPSLFSPGADLSTLRVFLNGAEVPLCSDPATPAPDPCVSSSAIDEATGELVLELRTTHASVLSFAVEPTTLGAAFCADAASGRTFADVPAGATHQLAIECFAALDVIDGVSETSFAPGQALSRAQAASLIARLADRLGITLPDVGASTTFSDVPAGSTHEAAIARLAGAGLLAGFEDGTFGPDAEITRGQFATIMLRLFEVATGGTLDIRTVDTFADDDGSRHESALERAAAIGLLAGFDADTVGPDRSTTRAQAATILSNLAGRLAAIGA